MIKQRIEITTATITIKVIQVNGNKMTKATFRQIEMRAPEHYANHILGWVFDDYNGVDPGIWIVWNDEGKIKRYFLMKDFDSQLIIAIKRQYDQLFIAT
jgi:hypothetical protein